MADNKELIRRIFDEVVNDGKIEAVDDLFHPDFQTDTPMGTLDREGFKGYVEMWRAAFPDVHCEVDDLISEGDRIAWSVRATGTNTGEFMGMPATGRSIDFDSLNIGEVRGGQAYPHKLIQDIPKMMEQLGLAPGQGS